MKLHPYLKAPPLIVSGGTALALMLALAMTIVLPERPTPSALNPVSSLAAPIEFGILDAGANLADLERGRAYYAQLCVACHGASGQGNGVWAYRVTPTPADLTSARVQNRSDRFLFDVISDGMIGTPMKGLKERLSEIQRGQIVKYLRHLGAQASLQVRADL